MKEWHGDDIEPVELRDPESDEREDIVLEAENNEPPRGGDCEQKVAKLKTELERVTAEKQENLDGWQRAKADYVNFLRRSEEAAKAAESSGKIKAVETLLPAFDALERAKEHGKIPEGFMAIAKQLENAFASLGLEEVGMVGEPFDPVLHEAFGQDLTENADADDTITAVLEKGWKVGDLIIRPAKVKVAHFESSDGKPNEGRAPGR